MIVFAVYVMFAISNCCGQKVLYADFANKIYPIISYHLFHLIPSVALSIPESLLTVFNEVLGYRFKHKAKM